MNGLNVKKIIDEKQYVIISSTAALKDVISPNWSRDVLDGKRKVIIKSKQKI